MENKIKNRNLDLDVFKVLLNILLGRIELNLDQNVSSSVLGLRFTRTELKLDCINNPCVRPLDISFHNGATDVVIVEMSANKVEPNRWSLGLSSFEI